MIRRFFNCSLSKTQIHARYVHAMARLTQFNYMQLHICTLKQSWFSSHLYFFACRVSSFPLQNYQSISSQFALLSIYTNSVNFGSRPKSYDWPYSGIRINGKSIVCSSSLRPGTDVGSVKTAQESRYKRFVPKSLRLCVFLFRNTINRPLTQRKKLILQDVTTDFLAKWRLRNERRNSILMTRHNPDLGSTFHWLKNQW